MTGCVFPTLTQADVAALATLEARELRKEALRRLLASTDELPTLAFVLANADDWQRCDAQHAAKMALIRAAWPLYQKRKGSLPLIRLSGRHVPNHARHVPPVLRASLNAFQHDHCPEVIAARALALMHVCAWRAARIDLCVRAGIRPRRVTIDGLVIVRGRR